jgi:aspartate 1-decarboxylase
VAVGLGCFGVYGNAGSIEVIMLRRMFLGKIHRATVTHADLDYEGSVTIDPVLMEAAGILPHEEIHVWNLTRGSRLVSYAIPGEAESGVICVNGAAAHLTRPGDLIILATFGELTEEEARRHRPRVVRVDAHNRLVSTHAEIPGPVRVAPAS